MATTSVSSPRCMAGMTLATPILAVLRMPQRIVGGHGQRMTPSSTLMTCEAQRSLPKVLKSWRVQTTFLSRVTSINCGLSGPAWVLPKIRLPLGLSWSDVTQAA